MWHLTVLTLLLTLCQSSTAARNAYWNDQCRTKLQPGICTLWHECPQMRTLIQNGEYTLLDVVRCGFTVYEELICCPVDRSRPRLFSTEAPNASLRRLHSTYVGSKTTSPNDFWLDVLRDFKTNSLSETTTQKQRFTWQDVQDQ